MKMSWEYLAGFFDGEGTIRIQSGNPTGGGTHWSIAQSHERGRRILLEVAEFLAVRGIKGRLHLRPDKCHTLYVSGRVAVSQLCFHLLPYLRVKKVETQDVLRYMTLYPAIKSGPILGMLISERRSTRNGHVRLAR